ncbi:MAG: hypothetical protein MJA29_05220 [Candidatus Omnitrophica bacterium]|nr:hypothetical protein [Candidatus Omnitrophota bacterium]
MIRSAHLGREIHLTVVNKIGVLADLSKTLADHGLDLEAVAGYSAGTEARISVVTSDSLRTAEALRKAKYSNVHEQEVLILEMENKPGVLKAVTSDLARESIDINRLYATACSADCPAKLVLSTSNNEKALVVFRRQP